jgi:hypothetical protein
MLVRRSFGSVLILLSFFQNASLWSQSQITTGSIEGTVADETGAVVSGANVNLIHISTHLSRTVITDEQGRYIAPLLPVGDYEITAQLPGFVTVRRTGVSLGLGQTQVIDLFRYFPVVYFNEGIVNPINIERRK